MPNGTFQGQPVVVLETVRARARIAPQFGGRLLTWEADGVDVLHWPVETDWANTARVRGGNPVLFPFLGRHFVDGAIGRWRDGRGTVRELPMHGFARDLPFAVVASSAGRVRMRLVDTPATRAGYPFEFRFDVVYALEGASLTAVFEIENRGAAPLPHYAGHHFYFALPRAARADWRFAVPCAEWIRQNPDGSLAVTAAGADAFSPADPAAADRMQGALTAATVTMENRKAGRKLTIDLAPEVPDLPVGAVRAPWAAVTTWTEKPESDFYCVEPWLGFPDAIHHGRGLRRVAPGVVEVAACRILI